VALLIALEGFDGSAMLGSVLATVGTVAAGAERREGGPLFGSGVGVDSSVRVPLEACDGGEELPWLSDGPVGSVADPPPRT